MKDSKNISREDGLGLIAESAVYGNLGLFVGAGMTMAILNDEWEKVGLSWRELIFRSAEEFDIDLKTEIKLEGLSYPEIATELVKLISKNAEESYDVSLNKLKRKIAQLTSWYPENKARKEYSQILTDIDPSWIITTNYDLVLECLLPGKSTSLGPNDQLISPKGLIPIYHLHGVRSNPDSIIISQEDYISLFRPNQYRQQKLSLSIKESTTLIVGYGLGDVNVLTAVDWTKNVYNNQKIGYPHEIIQLLYTTSPKQEPYRDRNNILIIEFEDLTSILTEIADLIKTERDADSEQNKDLEKLNGLFYNPDEKNIEKFIDNEKFRNNIIEILAQYDVKVVSGFLELFSKSIDKTWERAVPNGAFFAYNEGLIVLLDVLENLSLEQIPPAVFESVTYHLQNLCYYVGPNYGQSTAAGRTWRDRKGNIPQETIDELFNLSRARRYDRLLEFLEKSYS